MLVGAAQAIDDVQRMQGKGLETAGAHIDWSALIRFKETFVDTVPDEHEASYAKAGIAAFHGVARFVGPTAIQIGSDLLDARHILIAAGARPAPLGLPGEELITNSTAFLNLKELPARIVFIGGGFISFEFAHVARRAGAEVTILHRGACPLAGFDPDLVDQLAQTTREIGIDLKLNSIVKAIEKTDTGLAVRADGEGGSQSYEADLVVHGAGRVPEIDDLNLQAGGVEREKQGVRVNEYLQSVSNPAVYAAGDCAALAVPRLTPVSSMEGEVAADNLLHGNRRRPDFTEVPTVVYTIPPLASVGLQEQAARDQGLKFRTNRQDTTAWYSSRRLAVRQTGSKVLVEEETGRILGAHLFGPHADELINLFAIAIRFRLTSADLERMIFAYPTGASDISYLV
ncbi:MAG: NAD(P)/FAD-dependent oxidoreductase [Chloroflexi bacterium]|nr:NAD(P)/FAD-dependent oxidoreductase [Chloroflexota bacterium]